MLKTRKYGKMVLEPIYCVLAQFITKQELINMVEKRYRIAADKIKILKKGDYFVAYEIQTIES